MLNKKVNDDGTVNLLNQSEDFNEVNKVIDKKLSDLLEKKMNSMLESKLPQILDNYFKNKK
jgi:predicted metal-dependent hydrolase